MAQTIPTTISSKWKGERQVFAMLKRLPDDIIVYHEPIIDNRLPDFVVILRTGVLVIEVKDWKLEAILPCSNQKEVQLRTDGQIVPVKHPVRQSRDYQDRLRNRCRKHKHFANLLDASGYLKFPFGNFAILTNITREKLNTLASSEDVFPAETVATKDQLAEWLELEGEELLKVLNGYFDVFRPRHNMTPNQVNVMKAIIHPEILISSELDHATEREPTVKVLDLKQESLARDVGEGHRLVFGVAGSGKTVMLLARAKMIAHLNRSARILVLCYNVAFGAYLKEALKACPRASVRVMTFHAWAMRNGVEHNEGDDDSQIGEKLLPKLRAGALDSKRYDTVLVDEAQDFDSTWYPCVLAAMKDPVNCDLLIVGDGSQGLYRRRKVSWKRLGIQASGRTQYLLQNYRNTRPIMELAALFASGSGETEEDSLSAPLVDPNQCVRLAGAKAFLLQKQSKQDEVERVARAVSDLLDGRWFGESVPALRTEQIAILYRMDNGLIRGLCEKLGKRRDCPVVWLTEKGKNAKGRIAGPGVKILTMHSAKGLQFKAVFVIFANDCPVTFGKITVEEERCLFYVALTRAEDYLAISCSGKVGFGADIAAAGADDCNA